MAPGRRRKSRNTIHRSRYDLHHDGISPSGQSERSRSESLELGPHMLDEVVSTVVDTSSPLVKASKNMLRTLVCFMYCWFQWRRTDTFFTFVLRVLIGLAFLALTAKFCMANNKYFTRYYNKMSWYFNF